MVMRFPSWFPTASLARTLGEMCDACVGRPRWESSCTRFPEPLCVCVCVCVCVCLCLLCACAHERAYRVFLRVPVCESVSQCVPVTPQVTVAG